jgi:hypothetical protein
MIVINPLIAIVIGCVVCSITGTIANACPISIRGTCQTIAAIVNLLILIVVIYLLVTSTASIGRPSKRYRYY